MFGLEAESNNPAFISQKGEKCGLGKNLKFYSALGKLEVQSTKCRTFSYCRVNYNKWAHTVQ